MSSTIARAQIQETPGGPTLVSPEQPMIGKRAVSLFPHLSADASVPSGAPFKQDTPAAIRSFSIPGPAGRLEAILNQGAPNAGFAALVCHPHPSFGGNLHNKVVYYAMKVLNDPQWGLGLPVLRFNFRGTGLSEGSHDGVAENADVVAAIDWLDREFQLPIVLAGFSFGAAMALHASVKSRWDGKSIHALAALGLPLVAEFPQYQYPFLDSLRMRKLFLSGERDQFAPATEMTRVVASAAEPRRLIFVPGADHFFTDQLEPMQDALAGWLKEQLQ